MGGDVGRVLVGVATGGFSEVVNAASGGSLYKKDKKDKKAAAAGSKTPEYNIYESGRDGGMNNARKAALLSTSDGSGTKVGGNTLLGG